MDIQFFNQNSSRTKSLLDSYYSSVIDTVLGLSKSLEVFFQSLFQKVVSVDWCNKKNNSQVDTETDTKNTSNFHKKAFYLALYYGKI